MNAIERALSTDPGVDPPKWSEIVDMMSRLHRLNSGDVEATMVRVCRSEGPLRFDLEGDDLLHHGSPHDSLRTYAVNFLWVMGVKKHLDVIRHAQAQVESDSVRKFIQDLIDDGLTRRGLAERTGSGPEAPTPPP